jgi:HlyD family secretion protein
MNVMGKIEAGSEVKPRRFKLRYFVLAAALLGGAVVAFKVFGPKGSTPSLAEMQADKLSAQLITAAPVERRAFSRMAPVSGEARPVNDVRVFAPANGVRVAEVIADIGDVVKAGDPLARLEAGVAEAQTRAAQAQMQEARVEQARTAAEYARARDIADSGALSKEAIDARRAAAEAAAARYAAQRAAFTEVSTRMQGGFVRAPVSGLVIERNARVGEFADQKALFRIVGDNRLEVAAQVAESDILALKNGHTAIFRTSDGTSVEGSLRRPPVAINPETRTGEALFDLPADGPVRAGMYLRGEVAVEKGQTLSVPQTAISYATGTPSVFVVENGRARRAAVELGGRAGDYVAVISGLKEGDIVAASGGAFLQDGDAVRTPGEAEPAPKKAESAARKKRSGAHSG